MIDPGSLVGHLLAATPPLGDPNFDHTVVVILDHDEDGALGVVVNRPSETGVGDVLPGWDRLTADPPLVFVGGPVRQDGILGLVELLPSMGPPPRGIAPLGDRLATIDLDQDPVEVAGVGRLRLYAGYAGWAPGQLEAEIAEGVWFTIPAHPDDAFTREPDQLWARVIRRQGGTYRAFPADPATN